MGDIWTDFADRVSSSGGTPRDHAVHNLRQRAAVQLRHNPSFQTLLINGETREMAVMAFAKRFNMKKLCALPGEHITHGGLVCWKGAHWIVTQIDADDTAYESALMQQCNYRLKWNDAQGRRIEKWCIVEDGTKYLEGLYRFEMMELGAARIAVTVAKDDDTTALRRGDRFIIADPDADEKLSYRITKPNTLFNIFADKGIYRYIMTETVVESEDNTLDSVARDNPELYPVGSARYDAKNPEGAWL